MLEQTSFLLYDGRCLETDRFFDMVRFHERTGCELKQLIVTKHVVKQKESLAEAVLRMDSEQLRM